MGLEVIETQTYAVSEPGDPLLRRWRKGEKPLLDAPPFKCLTGWRDPFLVGRPGDGLHNKYTMIIGAGFSERPRGTALVYTSNSPITDWQYQHELCEGDGTTGSIWECPLLAKIPPMPEQGTEMCSPSCLSEKYGPPREAIKEGHDWAFIVCPDNAEHAPVYWLGNYDHTVLKFDLQKAFGPYALDLGGNTFYAPNMLTNDPKGRLVMWGWCQETGRPEHISGEHEYGSCMSVPRMLWRHPRSPGRLWQEPLPSISELRMSDASWWEGRLDIMPGKPFPLPREVGEAEHVELELTFDPPLPLEPMEEADGAAADPGEEVHKMRPQVLKSGIIFRPHPSEAPSKLGIPSGLYGAALLYDWNEERLDVVYSNGRQQLDDLCALPFHLYKDASVDVSDRMAGAVEERDLKGVHQLKVEDGQGNVEERSVDIAGTHIVGSKLHFPLNEHGQPEVRPLTLRIFLDHSLLEVFTCTGEVLTCRVYRESEQVAPGNAEGLLPVHHGEGTIELATWGAPTPLTHIAAHLVDEM
ncbi:glycosyl hydrolase [Dunaliella salina]|uniref:Glycosyl hydrolase n=1 Tax=Dunaliella salina TaxID=3046 RepID=A0ABQ7G634_DUNSA|nr:glycosyl hydrolase [Dunaliella salina]|eukprot:KAF5830052.1 glycosyl hydrolase [Dunaliella salina]